jgi:hypothetical protein
VGAIAADATVAKLIGKQVTNDEVRRALVKHAAEQGASMAPFSGRVVLLNTLRTCGDLSTDKLHSQTTHH